MPKVLVVTVQKYNRNELWPVLKALADAECAFEIVSTDIHIADEKRTEAYTLKSTLDDIPNFDAYDGLVLISGDPKDTEALWYDSRVQSLTVQAKEKNAVIGAICAAVPALRGIAKDVQVSAYPLKKALEVLEDAGAIVRKVSLTTFNKIVTAENEAVAGMWADNIIALLRDEEVPHTLHESPFKRALKERKPIPEVERLSKIMERTGKNELSSK